MSFCEICNTTECGLCNAPMPKLERQTNQVGPREAYLVDEHEECDNEPCASCLERWECDLEALKSLDEIDGLTAYHIARHEKMVEAGKNRQRKVAAFQAARQAYLDEPLQRHVFRTHFPLEMPQIQLLERQTNDHPINFQPPQPQCLVKNCACSGTGAIAHLVKEVNGELVPW